MDARKRPQKNLVPELPQQDKRHSVAGYALGLDALAGIILTLLLWELRMSPITYIAVGVALAACICAFIWFFPLPHGLEYAAILRVGICIVAMVLLGGVLVPQGIDRFGQNSVASSQILAMPPTIGPVTNQGGNVVNVPGNNNTVTIAPDRLPSISLVAPSTIHTEDDRQKLENLFAEYNKMACTRFG